MGCHSLVWINIREARKYSSVDTKTCQENKYSSGMPKWVLLLLWCLNSLSTY